MSLLLEYFNVIIIIIIKNNFLIKYYMFEVYYIYICACVCVFRLKFKYFMAIIILS